MVRPRTSHTDLLADQQRSPINPSPSQEFYTESPSGIESTLNLDIDSLGIPMTPASYSSELINPTRSTFYIIILTIIIGSLQLAWSTEFSEGTPFLLSLGVSKQVLALIWIAGPISGTVGQPIVGIYSDQCNASIGRRKPFIIGGCLATVFSLLYLSHSTSIVGWFVNSEDQDYINHITVPFASMGIYVLDFSIAVIQASGRAFIVDCVPTDQQQIANAWAARMIGIFNIIGFYIGTLQLVEIFPFLGDNQFKVLSILVSTIMIVLTSISIFYIKERNPKTDAGIIAERKKQMKKLKDSVIISDDANSSGSTTPNGNSAPNFFMNFFKVCKSLLLQTIYSIKKLPPQVKTVCYAEFFAWIGYFPMLFYTTTYVGELYLFENGYSNPNDLPVDRKQELLDESTRRGTMALLVHAIVTLVVDLILPYLVENQSGLASWIKNHITIKKIWILAHIVFIVSTFMTFFIRSSTEAIVLFAFLGIPWGVAVWAPFVLISEEISRIKDIKNKALMDTYSKSFKMNQVQGNISAEEFLESSLSGTRSMSESDSFVGSGSIRQENKFGTLIHHKIVEKYDKMEYDSGILLAIHNVFVSAPQMISSLGSSILFKMLSSYYNSHPDAFDDSLGWSFRLGGLATLLALYLSFEVKTSDQLMMEDELETKFDNV